MKRTKIVCTIGPASEKRTVLEKMIKNGMNVARLNFSHGNYSSHKQLIKNVRQAAINKKTNVAIIQDLQGPRIRVGQVVDDSLKIKKGEKIALMSERLFKFKKKIKDYVVVPIQYQNLYRDVSKGDRILIEDGLMQFEVLSVEKEIIKCQSKTSGLIKSNKGINVPGVKLKVDVITEKDKKDVEFGVKQGVDYVALSFVKEAADILRLRSIMEKVAQKSKKKVPLIIAKIERQEALDNFEKILEAVDGIMIARGDLGLEISAAKVPVWQKKMIGQCLQVAKPVIVATQMLASMTNNIQPTRAEVSDVANAVIDHTDAVMLSAESATGKFPVEAVDLMTKTIVQAEQSKFDDLDPLEQLSQPMIVDNIARAAAALVPKIDAKAILVINIKQTSVRQVARFRPEVALVTLVNNARLCEQLALVWGVGAYLVPKYSTALKYINKGIQIVKKERIAKKGDRVIVVIGNEKQFDNLNTISVITVN